MVASIAAAADLYEKIRMTRRGPGGKPSGDGSNR
jgi:hypothetical protein